MRIQRSQITIVFERDLNIRSKMVKFEKQIETQFITPFLIVNNIHDQADSNIFRFQTPSLNGFSNISISQNRVILDTSYSGEYAENNNQIKKYLESKLSIISDVISEQKIQFFGIVLSLESQNNQNDLLSHLKNKLDISLINSKTLDFRYYYSEKYKNEFFINIEIGRCKPLVVRQNEEDNKDIMKNEISIKLDFNNKLGFQNKQQYVFVDTYKLIDEIFHVVKNNNVNNFITANLK